MADVNDRLRDAAENEQQRAARGIVTMHRAAHRDDAS
jgi:hypothetical protein